METSTAVSQLTVSKGATIRLLGGGGWTFSEIYKYLSGKIFLW